MPHKHIWFYSILFSLICSFTVAQQPIVESNALFTFIYDGPSVIYVDSSCTAPLQWGHPNNPRVIYDGPAGGVLVGFNITSISGGYSIGDLVMAGEVVKVTYRAYDNMGNDARFSFQITFSDSLPPVWQTNTLPSDVTIQCLDELTAGQSLATDNCSDSSEISYSNQLIDPVSECQGGTFIQRYFAEDEYGNQAIYDQQITILQDQTPPVFTILPQGDTSYCEDLGIEFPLWVSQQLALMEATDNSCDSVIYGLNTTSTDVIDTACGTVDIEFYAEDQCGNRTVVTAPYTIIDTVGPVLLAPAMDAHASCDMPGNATVLMDWLNDNGGMQVSDNCELFWRTVPENIEIEDFCNDSIVVTFIAEDRCGSSVQSEATFVLIDTTPPLIVSPPSNLIATCGNQDYLTVAENWLQNLGNADVEDFCSHDTLLSIEYEVNGQLLNIQEVLDSFDRSALEGCKDDVLIGGNSFDNVLAAIQLSFVINDPCGNSNVTRSVWLALIDQIEPQMIQQAMDTVLNCQSRDSLQLALFQWYDNHGGLRATDDCGTVLYPATKSRNEIWQELQDSMDANCGNTAQLYVTFLAEDLCGNLASGSQEVIFTVIDTVSPAVSGIQNSVKNCRPGSRDSVITWLDQIAFAQVVEDCGSYTVDSFTWFTNAGDSGTGMINGGPYPDISAISCNYRIDATFYVTDECGNPVSFSAFYVLFDLVAPTFQNVSDTVQLSCGEEYMLDPSNVQDNCTVDPSLTYSDDTSRVTDTTLCAYYNFEILRTYTAEDACGNTASFSQALIITDSTAPDFDLPDDVLVQCDQLDSLALTGSPSMISDACQSPVTISYSDSIMGSGCTYEVVRSWKAVDICGNERTKEQLITVSDTLAPILIEGAQDLTHVCDQATNSDSVFQAWLDSLSASFEDNCLLEGTFTAISDSYQLGDTSTWPGNFPSGIEYTDCAQYQSDTVYSVKMDVVAFDACNNAEKSTATFVLIDNSAPQIECDGDLEIETDPASCSANFSLPVLSITDNCSSDQFTVSYQIEGVDTLTTLRPDTLNLALEKGVYPVLIEATDCAGNIGSCSYNLNIVDRERPAISCMPDTSFFIDSIGCQREVRLLTPLNVTDNCALSDTLDFSYFVKGATDVPAQFYRQFDPAPLVTLNGGFNQVSFVVQDASGNSDTCTYEIVVRDTVAPFAVCQPATIFANPSGVVFTRIDGAEIDGGSTDNCKVDSFWTRPQSVRCQQAGQQLDVTLFVYDEFGNVDSCETVIRVETQILQPSYEVDICDPDTLRLFANAPPPNNVYTFNWTGPNGFTSNQRNPIIINVGPQNSGTYHLSIQGFDNCTAEGSVSINISDIATPDLDADQLVNCEGNDIRLVSNAFSGPVTYNWYEGLPPGGSLINTTSEPVLEVTPPPGSHDYYVIVEANNCTSNPSTPLRIEIITQPVAMVDTSFISVCAGEDIRLQAIDQGPGYEYRWTGPNGFFSTLASPPVIMNAGPANEGQYVLVVETGDCSSAPIFVDVLVNPLPSVPEVQVKNIYCEGENLSLTVSNPVNSDIYYWTSPSDDEYTTSGPVFNFGPVSASEAGIWKVSTELNGCRSATEGEVFVNVEILPDIEIEASGSFCEGDSIMLSADPYPNATYSWSGPAFMASGRIIELVPAAGIYNVTLTSENGCETSASEMISLIEPPSITAISNSGMDCIEEGTDIRLVPTVFPVDTGNYQYRWVGPNNFASSDSIAVINNASQNNNGYYTLTVIKEGCASEPDSTRVLVTRIPEKPGIMGATDYCRGDSILLFTGDPGQGEQQFLWIGPQGDTLTSTGRLVIPDATLADSGYYQLRTIVNNCESPLSDSVLIRVKPVPAQPTIKGTAQLCEGDTIVIYPGNFAANLTYEWTFPDGSMETNDTIIIYNAASSDQGLYRVRAVKDNCASSFSTAFNIQVSPIPTVPLIDDIDRGICLLDENASFEACIESSSATTGALYYWYNAANRELLEGPSGSLCAQIDSLSGFRDGTNSIIVQAELNGCFSQTSIPENINMSLPQVTEANGGNDRAICTDERAMLNAVPPIQGNGSWSVVMGDADLANPGQANTEVFNLDIGQNLFAWSLSYGFCENYASDTVTILFDEAPFTEEDSYVTSFNTRITMDVLENDDIVGPARLSILRGPYHGTAQVSGNNINYFPANGYIGKDTVVYQLCSVNCPDLCDSSEVVIQVGDESLCNIPAIFTPNSDGVNDFFTIQCLSSSEYDDNRVVIFNQYGDEVFFAQPYENNWQGTYNGNPLPAGTYYYIVDFGTGRIEKGFLILER